MAFVACCRRHVPTAGSGRRGPQLVRPALAEGAVRVDAAVAEEGPALPDDVDVREVERRDERFLLVLRALRQDLAHRAADEAAAPEAHLLFLTHPVRYAHEHSVLDPVRPPDR